MKMIKAGKLDPSQLISHHFRLDQIAAAYEIFKNAAQEQAIKIVLSSDEAAAGAAVPNDERVIRQIVAQVLAKL